MDRPRENETSRPQGAAGVAEVARIIAASNLVEGFGHVSTRTDEGFMITPTRPLATLAGSDVIDLDADGRPATETRDVPLEAPMHAAVYRTRKEVGAVVRTHSPAVVVAGANGVVPPLVHGLGGLAGDVALCDRIDLVADRDAGIEVAADLGEDANLLLRDNGSFSVGADLGEAVVRAWYLEQRCLVGSWVAADRGIDTEQLAARSRWFEAESERALAWLRSRYGAA